MSDSMPWGKINNSPVYAHHIKDSSGRHVITNDDGDAAELLNMHVQRVNQGTGKPSRFKSNMTASRILGILCLSPLIALFFIWCIPFFIFEYLVKPMAKKK